MPISVEGVWFVYMEGTPYRAVALENVNLAIQDGEFLGIIGPTGSGKSTLAQHLNGLLRPTRGRVVVDGIDLTARGAPLKLIRQKVGLVFQYPEHQLFEETAFDDVAFGPRNARLPEPEVAIRVSEAMNMVGVDFERLKKRSPFELSGGQMRRLAIAGVLAMRPKVLVLDEPTAGLDPRGRDEILGQIRRMHGELGITVILISHNMEEVGRLVDRVVVMDSGSLVMDGPPRKVFQEVGRLKKLGLAVPQVTELMHRLKECGKPVRTDIVTVQEAKTELLSALGAGWPCSGTSP